MRLGYLTGRYPAISHTFILREIRALRALGLEIETFSIWRTAPSELISVDEREENSSTYALLPPTWGHWLRAHASAVLHNPRRWLGTLRAALGLAPTTPRGIALGVSWFAEAMVLWERCRARSLQHVHVHLNGTAPSVALLAARFGGEGWSFSMTVHGSAEFYDVAAEALPEKVRAAAFVIAVSDFTRSQLLGMVEEEHWAKIHVVHCGVDPDVFAAQEPAGQDDVLGVLCVGRLVRAKGQGVLLHAVSLLASRGVTVHVTFVGDGPGRTHLERVARELDIRERVNFAGSVSQEHIREFYAAADVFCLPSFAEGVPVVLMEAMVVQLAVVTTTVGGIGELVIDGVNGVTVRPSRPDLVADALERLAADPAERARMGRAARETVRAEFDVTECAARLAAVMHEEIGGGPGPLPVTVQGTVPLRAG